MKEIVIVGAGGFGREVLWLIERINAANPEWNVLGFIDSNPDAITDDRCKVIGDDDWLLQCERQIAAVIAMGSPFVRKEIWNKLSKNEKISFPTLIDPSAIVSTRAKIGRGCIICAASIVSTNAEIADFCVVNFGSTLGHDSSLHDFATLSPGVNISGGVTLGRCVEIGTGSKVVPQISIGAGSMVGVGSAVIKDVPENQTVFGVPARSFGLRK